MVADHAQHGFAVALVGCEGTEFARHLGAGGVGIAREDSRERGAPLGAFDAVVGDAHAHEHGAQVRVAETQRAEIIGELRDGLAGELGHEHREFQHDGPQADAVAVALEIETAVGREETAEVQGRQVAGGVVQEHVLGARIARVDGAARRAGVPLVDGGIELNAGVGAGPGGGVDLLPEFAGLQRPRNAAIRAAHQVPGAVLLQGLHEFVGHAHGVVGVHAPHGVIALAIPGGVVLLEIALEVAHGQTAQALSEERGRYALFLRLGHGLAQLLIGLWIGITGGAALDRFA